LGISLAPFATVDFELIDITIYVFAFVYFLAALVNLLMLSYQDAEVDKKDGFGSVLVLIPKTGLKNLILVFGLTGIGILIVLAAISPSYYHVESVILGLIIGYHLILFFSKNQTKDQVRRKSEALFLLPFLLLLF
jgi:4-hydroxybenzoate polyprenyltransferase